ncbi:MAG: hypothetical protein IPO00_08325 [Betaproteobacteria bacterium]|nr:hypothetical protein [Betaproteobacteria bacterium]
MRGGMTLEEIASATGTGRETVKSRLRYAMSKLRHSLKDCCDQPQPPSRELADPALSGFIATPPQTCRRRRWTRPFWR